MQEQRPPPGHACRNCNEHLPAQGVMQAGKLQHTRSFGSSGMSATGWKPRKYSENLASSKSSLLQERRPVVLCSCAFGPHDELLQALVQLSTCHHSKLT